MPRWLGKGLLHQLPELPECPAAFPVCRAAGGGGALTCRTAVVVDAGTPADASTILDAAGQ